MDNDKILVLMFKKNNGSNFRFGIAFPADAIEGAKVKALGQMIVENEIFEFKDGSKVAALEKAYILVTQKQDIALA